MIATHECPYCDVPVQTKTTRRFLISFSQIILILFSCPTCNWPIVWKRVPEGQEELYKDIPFIDIEWVVRP